MGSGACLFHPCIPSSAHPARSCCSASLCWKDGSLLVPVCHALRAAKVSLMVQWLRLRAPNAGGPGSTPGQGTRSHMLQLGPGAVKWRNGFFKDRPAAQGPCGVPDICLQLSRVYLTCPAHCPPKRPSFAESTDLGTCLAVQCYAGEHVIWSWTVCVCILDLCLSACVTQDKPPNLSEPQCLQV